MSRTSDRMWHFVVVEWMSGAMAGAAVGGLIDKPCWPLGLVLGTGLLFLLIGLSEAAGKPWPGRGGESDG